MFNILKLAMAGISIYCFLLIIRNLMSGFYSTENSSLHKKRLEQLKFENKRTSSDSENKELIDKITAPVVTHILPKMKSKDLTQLEKDLQMAQWDKYFTPVTFTAMDVLLKILGIIAFVLFIGVSMAMAVLWGALLIFLFKFLFNNSLKERKFRLMAEFPEFIEITAGFLNSDMSLSQGIEYSLPYVGEEWKPILQEFIISCSMKDQSEAINEMQNKIDIFEVREFWSLVKLNTDQGIDIKECFEAQSQKVRELQLDVMLDKIGKRQVLSIAIQGPLLLTMILSFGLPTFASMVNLGF